jgi:hypothetical protein
LNKISLDWKEIKEPMENDRLFNLAAKLKKVNPKSNGAGFS